MESLIPLLVSGGCCCATVLGLVAFVLALAMLFGGGGPEDPLVELAEMLNETPFFVDETDTDGPPADMSADESAFVNSMGQKLVFGDPDDVVDATTAKLEEGPSDTFRRALLNQRGGAHAMAKRWEAAKADYQAAVDFDPEDKGLLGNLAEAHAHLGEKNEVYALVDRFVELGGKLDMDQVNELKEQVENLVD